MLAHRLVEGSMSFSSCNRQQEASQCTAIQLKFDRAPCFRRGGRSLRLCRKAVSVQQSQAAVDWDNLAFGLENVGQQMYVASHENEDGWQGSLQPYGPMPLLPSSQVFNYGQSVLEGLKAQRSEKGKIVLFRPEQNAARMQDGADRLTMPQVPKDMFMTGILEAVKANQHLVPPYGKGSLYIRPLLFGSGSILGLGPAPHYKFVVYCAAVGSYFKSGQMEPIDLVIEEQFHRAAPGGMGATKAAGNYSPVLLTQLEAKKQGYDDVIYLDARSDTFLEEVSSCNIFIKKGDTIKTPPLGGTILPGITRMSLLQLAQDMGYKAVEEPVSITEALEADEVFTCGTAVVLASVGSLTYQGKKTSFGEPNKPGTTAQQLYDQLTGVQLQKLEDKHNWVYEV